MLLLCLLPACATSRKNIVPIDRTDMPERLAAEEQDLRETVLQFQKHLRENGAFYPDPVLEKYLEVLAAPFAKSFEPAPNVRLRIRVLREPTVNAVSLMNGHIYVHSGLLARLKNEAQLAFVLAHEISHIYHRDTLYQTRNLKRKTVTFKVLDLFVSPSAAMFGVDGLSDRMLTVIYSASITGYGRDSERAADRFALEQMIKAGYDPREALGYFDIVMKEQEDYQEGREIFFLASHPSNTERKRDIARWLDEHFKKETQDVRVGRRRYARSTYRVRRDNARFNLDLDRFFHAMDDIRRVIRQKPRDPVAYCVRGDIYTGMPGRWEKIEQELSEARWRGVSSPGREKAEATWREKALHAYQQAMDLEPEHAPAYRGLGVSYLGRGDLGEARSFFLKYLELDPDAPDKRSVVRYLKDMSAGRVPN